ncbi:UNVERIFIED_CONTAM: hypothetical protein ABID98_004344 [Brevibacillus sp. OAP136]
MIRRMEIQNEAEAAEVLRIQITVVPSRGGADRVCRFTPAKRYGGEPASVRRNLLWLLGGWRASECDLV